MTQPKEAPARVGDAETGADLSISLAAFDGQNPKPITPAAQAARRELILDAAVESAWIASVAVRHFAENAELGRMPIAEVDLRCAIAHLREAASKFREWQDRPLPAREMSR